MDYPRRLNFKGWIQITASLSVHCGVQEIETDYIYTQIHEKES